MAYSAPSAATFRDKGGTLSEKITTELGLIDAAIDAIEVGEALQQSKFLQLTPAGTTLAGAGIDLATGSDIEAHGFFFQTAVTVIAMHDYLGEAYVKDTSDAKIEIYTEAASPVKVFGRTLTAGGEAVRAAHSTSPETGQANLAAGQGIYLKAVNTGSSSGTGHAVVTVEYIER